MGSHRVLYTRHYYIMSRVYRDRGYCIRRARKKTETRRALGFVYIHIIIYCNVRSEKFESNAGEEEKKKIK